MTNKTLKNILRCAMIPIVVGSWELCRIENYDGENQKDQINLEPNLIYNPQKVNLEKMMKDPAYRMLHNLQTESGSENFNLDDYLSREAERLKKSYTKEIK